MNKADPSFRAGRIPYTRLVAPMIDQIPAAVALFDRDLACVLCNAGWKKLLRLPPEIQPPFSREYVTSCERGPWRAALQRALAGEVLSREFERLERADGTVDWVRWSVSPWKDTKGTVRGALMVCEDVTAEMEQSLRSKVLKEELSLFIDTAEDFALCMLDDEGRITIWNEGAERLCGWREGEVQGESFDILFDPGERTRGLPKTQLRLARRNGSFRDRCWRTRKDGTRFLAEVTITRIEGDEILPSGFGQVLRDITHEDTQARSLEASTVLLRSILDTVPDALVVIDVEGRILLFSKAAEEMFGYSASEVVGRNVAMLMPSPDREEHDAHLLRYRTRGESKVIGLKRRVHGLRKDGSIFPHTLRIGEAFGGGERMFAGFIQDLTHKEQTEARMEELQRELAHIGRVSDMGTLSTAIAHELNQPLMAISNIVQTSAELLRRGEPGSLEKVADALEEAGHEALRAGEIVKRLRSFMARGDIDRTLEDPGKLARDACTLAAAGIRHRNVEWSLEVEPGLEPMLVDRVQIQQVLFNLVRNAIDAVERDGQVTIAIAKDDAATRFTVTDSGPGVPPERVARLFAPFSTTKRDGMGMGLAICRTIVEAHGGRIWYDPDLAAGAAFLFTVPAFREEDDHAD
ncbi:PAS domain S-box protein [Erythrobacter sp.]|uniref:PAS domain S-box protein n=1 Tax=Erythrobacter sp. TaxID=1042 RepID=UPI001425DF6E|nr:PAS domain S-box protein [Erythrobacter sp.]QIQ85695.1 MAG: PAS domain S-box protein [Erythrobacter sp.]